MRQKGSRLSRRCYGAVVSSVERIDRAPPIRGYTSSVAQMHRPISNRHTPPLRACSSDRERVYSVGTVVFGERGAKEGRADAIFNAWAPCGLWDFVSVTSGYPSQCRTALCRLSQRENGAGRRPVQFGLHRQQPPDPRSAGFCLGLRGLYSPPYAPLPSKNSFTRAKKPDEAGLVSLLDSRSNSSSSSR